MPSYFRVILWLFMVNITCLLLIGFVKQHIWRHPSSCGMTYMYQNPQYIPVELDSQTKANFPNYKLWIYGEGEYARQLQSNRSYNGVPVLFIPGNSGSYKQVRSLASVSMTKSENNRSPITFNYFAVDFSEEFSAFYGGCPFRETEFVAACIERILRLYSSATNPPSSVILIGHSMGGVIASAVLSLPNFNPQLVQVIYTIGSPHFHPVAIPDFEMLRFYDQVQGYWSGSRNGGNSSHVNVLSIGSGVADVMVKSELVQLPVTSPNSLVVMTTQIPHVWTTMDHLCLLWCNQLVLSIVRSMFELVDSRSVQLKEQPEARQAVLRKHFLVGNGAASVGKLKTADEVLVGHDWLYQDNVMQWSGHSSAGKYEALLLDVDEVADLVIKTFNMDLNSWVFGCQLIDNNKCKLGSDYSLEGIYLPSSRSTVKFIHLQRQQLMSEKHLVILLPKQKRKEVLIYAERFDSAGRYLSVDLSSAFLGSKSVDIQPHSVFSSVSLRGYLSPWLAFRVSLKPDASSCQATSHFHSPWNHEDTFASAIDDRPATHTLRLINNKRSSAAETDPTLSLYLDPKCSYSLRFHFSLVDTVEQIVRRHWLQMPIFLCACLLQSLAKQFYSLATTGKVASGWNTANVYFIFRNILVVQVFSAVYSFFSLGYLPALHWIYTAEDKFHSIFVFLFIYLAVAGFGTAFLALINALIVTTAFVTASIIKLLKCGFVFGLKTDFGLVGSVLAVLLSAVGLYVAQATSGVLILFLISLISIAKMFWSYVMMFGLKSNSSSAAYYETQAKLNVTLGFLWIAAFLSKGTQFAYWLRNLQWSVNVDPDPSFFPTVIIAVAFITFRPFDLRNKQQLNSLKLLSSVENTLALLVLLFEVEHVHLLIWTLALNALVISVWSSLTRNRSQLTTKSAEIVNDSKKRLTQWQNVIK